MKAEQITKEVGQPAVVYRHPHIIAASWRERAKRAEHMRLDRFTPAPKTGAARERSAPAGESAAGAIQLQTMVK